VAPGGQPAVAAHGLHLRYRSATTRRTRFEGYQPARTIITLQWACSETLLDTLPSR
jgi:hypothetical protein